MTTPGAPAASRGAEEHRLAVIAGWDLPLLRGAVTTLAAVGDRLPTWRARVEALGRELGSMDCWAGPAARNAAAAVLDLSAVATAVEAAVSASSAAYGHLLHEAEAAQELALATRAAAALTSEAPLQAQLDLAAAAAALAPWPPDAGSVPGLAAAALEHAEAVSRWATVADEALHGLVVRDAFVPRFGDLSALSGPSSPPELPVGRHPAEVAAWWGGLSAGAQLAAVRAAPAAVGALNGVPAWARDRANRLVLERALRSPDCPPRLRLTAEAVTRRIAAEEAAGRSVQLHLLDLEGDRVALALGDLDTADRVALLVPGIGTTPGDDLARLTGDARDLATAVRGAAPELTVATLVWLGYRPPTGRGIPSRVAAWQGGTTLAASLAGLAAARTATGQPPARTTVLAHSYGTVVVDEAGDVPGRLAADAVVLLGSPGMEDDADSLEVPEVHAAAAPDDLVARLGWFGSRTTWPPYGATQLPVEDGMGHSAYYDPEHPSLSALGEVLAGVGRQ